MREGDLTEQIIGGAIEVHQCFRVETGHQTDGAVMYSSSFSPHKPSAQMRDWESMSSTRYNSSGDCQSRICADLPSVFLCLRGESSCRAEKYRMLGIGQNLLAELTS